MPLIASALEPSSFPAWMERSAGEYAADLITLGNTPDEARRRAEASVRDAFPAGHPTVDNAVLILGDSASAEVGYVWVGRDQSHDPSAWWVWDILIEAEHRGMGYGKEGMRLAEDYARSQGALTLGLSVFGFNHSARGLYESLGYETTSIKMRKNLV